MFLKSLEIQGFKSFADKTKLEFGPGITCIVGPNGSGKSNICDAIRWVLGEQSLKALRGTKLEDIIFNGSEGRKPLGMASVTLVFDNSAGLLPLAFSEVTVTRRVYRSGESEFYINKVPCRLKDIQELFHDTGLGKEAFAIIGQGQVDAILSSRPEERRALFEEAAGIVRYRNRKLEATRKLEQTSANLQRLQDLLCELEQNLLPLEEEARRAQQYLALRQELDTLEISLSCQDIERLTAAREKLEAEKSALEQDLWQRETRYGVLTARLEELALEQQKVREEEQARQGDLFRLEQELQQKRGQKALARERLAALEERQASLREEQETHRARLQRVEGEYCRQQEHYGALAAQVQAEEDALAGREQQRQACQQELDRCLGREEELKNELFDVEQRLLACQNSSLEIQYELRNLQLQEQKLDREEQDWRRRREEQQEKLAEAGRQITARREELEAVQESCRQAVSRRQEAEQLLVAGREQLKKLDREIHATLSRCKVLEEMQENLEGYQAGIRNLLKVGMKSGAFRLLGVVGELLEVPPPYEKAIENALGGAIQYLVAASDGEARKAIEWLKRERAGRATFLPLNTLQPRRFPRELEPLLAGEGVLGLASELVKIAPGQEIVLDYLLGNVVVVRDLPAALSLARKSGFALKVVSLDGEVVFPGGSLTGGSHKTRETGLLSRRREIAEQKKRLDALRDREKALWDRLRETEARWEQLKQDETHWSTRQNQLELEISNLAKEQERLRQDLVRQEQEGQQIAWEREQLQAAREQLRERLGRLEEEREQGNRRKEALLGLLEENRVRAASLQQTLAQLSQAVTEGKVRLAALKEQLKSLEQAIRQAGESYRELQQREQALAAELAQLEPRREALTVEIAQLEEEELVLQRRCLELEKSRQSLSTRGRELDEEVQALQQEAGPLARELKDLKERQHQLDVQTTRLEVEWDNAVKRLQEKFQLTWEQAQQHRRPLPSRGEAEAKIRALKKEMEGLGPVNPNALAEYQRLKERYDFLRAQQKDLLKAREGLFQVIEEMERIMSLRFKETFQAVEEAFRETFAYFFGGGRATLSLTAPDNLLESGIEIVVQPPGKKMQNLSLLSGGERSLTAAALLFAFLMVKPSPLCILDEVEANLDEANVDRFAGYLRQFVDKTQFILISHRQGTMEAADALYGVTMEKSGVSRIVSVKLAPAVEVG